MSKFKYLNLVFDKALSKYGKLKTYSGIGITILLVLSQEAAKYLIDNWKGIPLPWAILISTLIFFYFFFSVSFEIAKTSLIPKLQITSGSGIPFEHVFENSPPISFIGGSHTSKSISWQVKLFRIQLENLGGQIIKNIQVRLKSIEPEATDLHVPLSLRKMHDHPKKGMPLQTVFELPPGDKAYFDVLQLKIGKITTGGEIEVTHTVLEIPSHIPRKDYRFTIEAIGHNTQPTENTFKLNLDDLNNSTFQIDA